MKIIQADIFGTPADAICITTNCQLRANGHGIAGAGIALAARKRYKDFEKWLGSHIERNGRKVGVIYWTVDGAIIALPTKNHWRDKSDLKFVGESIDQLVEWVDNELWETVLLPKPGCSNGGLDWETQVKPLLESKLDDRFIVCEYQNVQFTFPS